MQKYDHACKSTTKTMLRSLILCHDIYACQTYMISEVSLLEMDSKKQIRLDNVATCSCSFFICMSIMLKNLANCITYPCMIRHHRRCQTQAQSVEWPSGSCFHRCQPKRQPYTFQTLLQEGRKVSE